MTPRDPVGRAVLHRRASPLAQCPDSLFPRRAVRLYRRMGMNAEGMSPASRGVACLMYGCGM
jgi:hypothetical protein